jgi:uncharacterized protein
MIKTKVMKDPVHGYIPIENKYFGLIDTFYFQRLRNLFQVSTTYMVYPSATHSRFEHSIGVFHLSNRIFNICLENCPIFTSDFPADWDYDKRNAIVDNIRQTLRCASLLHDIGHYPFSHLGEEYADLNEIFQALDQTGFLKECFNFFPNTHSLEDLKIKLGKEYQKHELSSCALILTSHLRTILEDGFHVDPFEVCSFILGQSLKAKKEGIWQYAIAAQILNSPIDSDKLDYILRDHQTSGALISGIDSERLIMAYTINSKELVFSMKAISILNNFFLAKESIYLWVCQHHKVVFSNTLMKRIIELLPEDIKNELFSLKSLQEYTTDDIELLSKIRAFIKEKSPEAKLAKCYYDCFISRQFLASCWKHIIDYKTKITNATAQTELLDDITDDQKGVEKYIQSSLNLSEDQVIVGISEIRAMDDADIHEIRIEFGGETKSAADYGFFLPRTEFVRSIPYVYLAPHRVKEGIAFLKSYSTRSREAFARQQQKK